MALPVSAVAIALIAVVIFVAGVTNGLAGFGFALVGTMALATVLPPAIAVVFMILPIVAVNLSLVGELSPTELRTCTLRFWPLIGSALIGTVLGMALLNRVPAGPLRFGLGVLTLGFVATTQRQIPIPRWSSGDATGGFHGYLGMVGVGSIGGLLFGGTNVGVQLIAYLRSFDLSHGVFVGVVALVFLGVNGLRVAVAGLLGLYPGGSLFLASVGAALPAVLGVAAGKQLRAEVSERTRRLIVLGLLTAIGVRLIGV
jgi:uncharacterized membrane protein YfcA